MPALISAFLVLVSCLFSLGVLSCESCQSCLLLSAICTLCCWSHGPFDVGVSERQTRSDQVRSGLVLVRQEYQGLGI